MSDSDLSGWSERPLPGPAVIEGRTVRLEPITDESRFRELYEAFKAGGDTSLWAYLPYGPFDDFSSFESFAKRTYFADGFVFHAIIPHRTGRAGGVAALMRTDAANGVTEVGHICFSPALKASTEASEAIFRLMVRVFDELGYRRFEWKCDDGNAPSKRAAERFGFVFEGLFRQHMVVRGRNRDTAWYSIIDKEWPALKAAFEAWLDPANFDAEGRQIRALRELRAA
ncbi:GNAT family N-acetyltransferase [Mangrovicella endophytica]|uniref:GNAT family N-acetyltransferase n=1 Tax=Mangrovicella endophytica TaxID=2066697 RepID=UPI000C9DB804|nr:GNAT family protein [Mangrovicella endophytica]